MKFVKLTCGSFETYINPESIDVIIPFKKVSNIGGYSTFSSELADNAKSVIVIGKGNYHSDLEPEGLMRKLNLDII